MLTFESMNTAHEIAENLKLAGKFVAPLPGSPLEVLNNTVQAAPVDKLVEVATESYFNPQGHSHHTLEMDNIVSNAAKRVRALIDLARNQVNPMVSQVLEDINARYERSLDKIALNIEIITENDSPIFKNTTISDLVKTYVDSTITNTDRLDGIFVDWIENKVSYFSQGITGLEGELGLYLGQYGEDRLGDLFKLIFIDGNTYIGEDDVLPAFLMVNRLLTDEDLPEYILQGNQLRVVKLQLTSFRAFLANRLNGILARYVKRENAGTLIVSYPEAKATLTGRGGSAKFHHIVVNKALYDEYLEQGGSPDAIIGAYLVDRPRDVESLVTNNEKYVSEYEKKVRMVKAANDANKLDIMKRTIVRSIAVQLREVSEGSNPETIQQVINKVEDYLSGVTNTIVNDPYKHVLHIVAAIVFENLHAEAFLVDMADIAANDPELDIREVASKATFNYVLAWVRSQMLVSNMRTVVSE